MRFNFCRMRHPLFKWFYLFKKLILFRIIDHKSGFVLACWSGFYLSRCSLYSRRNNLWENSFFRQGQPDPEKNQEKAAGKFNAFLYERSLEPGQHAGQKKGEGRIPDETDQSMNRGKQK